MLRSPGTHNLQKNDHAAAEERTLFEFDNPFIEVRTDGKLGIGRTKPGGRREGRHLHSCVMGALRPGKACGRFERRPSRG